MQSRHAIVLPLLVCSFIASFSFAQGDRVGALPSPRLGMWWPDTRNQSLDDIARYDLVMLGFSVSDRDSIPGLRLRNPDILILTSTNACEIPSVPVNQITDPILRAWGQFVPTDWLLTQVGSTLTQGIDAAQTVLHMGQMTATSGSTTIELFAVGEDVVIGSEIATIDSIDLLASTITVRRGSKRAASAHALGVRVAALIEFWPETWVMDVSNNCPLVIVDPLVGPERWSDFDARFSAYITGLADWDGIIIDRSDPDESWLVGFGSARSIDPDRSNTLITDYGAFNSSWNAGLRNMESQLRNALGADQIIIGNLTMNNYDLLNGTVFEGFPTDIIPTARPSYSAEWEKTVFGPSLTPNLGSYAEWMSNAYSPPVCLIETYEDNGFPGDGGSGLACGDPGFVPNYRKMRFGLTTALMNDGFFSDEMSTSGHGALCLMWFDEYDNAGAGQGYLGMPIGPATQIDPLLTSPSLAADGTFEVDFNLWTLYNDPRYTSTISLDSTTAGQGAQSARIDVASTVGDLDVVLYAAPMVEMIQPSTDYVVSFWAKSDPPQVMRAWMADMNTPGDAVEIVGDNIPVISQWQYYELPIRTSIATPQAGLYLGVGREIGSVWFDDIQFQVGSSRQLWQREFEHGLVIVNATASPRVVQLGAPFRKINGTQDPAVNNGSVVETITVPAWDGVILLRCSQGCGNCPADLTGDGLLNFFDISTFLTAYGQQSPVADFTGDGLLNFFDVSAFLLAFRAGCP